MKVGEELFIIPKMGIIPEVTKQNYETIAKQLREVITNSLDAHATKVDISIEIDGEYTDMVIADNGDGMDEEDLKQQFLALGGSNKYYNDEKIGRIGIGFLAVAPLCEFMEIHSRKKGSNLAYIARLDSKILLDRSYRLEEIQNFAVGKIIDVHEDADKLNLDEHYTTIVLKQLTPGTIEVLNDGTRYDELLTQLRKILPLKFPVQCKLFEFISDDLKQVLIKETERYNIDVIINGKKLIKRVYGENKKHENFKVVMEIFNESPPNSRGRISGYLVDNYLRIHTWSGLLTRFQNIAVEDSGFLGWEKRPAALPRIMGELFITGLDKNSSISINRNEFNESDPDFYNLRQYIYEKLDLFTSQHYRRTYISSAINKEIKKKTEIKKNLKKITKAISKPKKKTAPKQKTIVKKPVQKVEASDLTEITINKRFGDVKVKVVNTITKEGRSKKPYTIEWSGSEGNIPTVLIEKKAVKEAGEDLEIEGKKFKVFFMNDEDEDYACRIDETKAEVLFNLDHPAIKKRNEKVVPMIFLVTYFYDKTKTKKEYKNRLIESLSELGD